MGELIRKSRVLLCALALASSAIAQGDKSKAVSLSERFVALQQEAWFVKGGWIADYDKALARAKKHEQLVFAYFTRSHAP